MRDLLAQGDGRGLRLSQFGLQRCLLLRLAVPDFEDLGRVAGLQDVDALGAGATAPHDVTGGSADGHTDSTAISASGRYVAFTSSATDLVADDGNDFVDVLVRDLETGTTTLVSRGHDGSPADEHSYDPCISDDGSIIAFHSDASNLTVDDANGSGRDVFVHDIASGVTWRAHRALDDGAGNGIAENCGLSGDGRRLAFESTSSDLVESDPNGAVNDIFRTDIAGDRIFADGFD